MSHVPRKRGQGALIKARRSLLTTSLKTIVAMGVGGFSIYCLLVMAGVLHMVALGAAIGLSLIPIGFVVYLAWRGHPD